MKTKKYNIMNIYILLDVLVYNIAVYFYEFCSILQRTSKERVKYKEIQRTSKIQRIHTTAFEKGIL